MADILPPNRLPGALTRALTEYQEQLERLKKTALSHKAECDQKYDELVFDLVKLLSSEQSALDKLAPNHQELQQRDTQPRATKRPLRPSREKRVAQARKEGV